MLWKQTEPSEVADELHEIHRSFQVIRESLEDQADRAPYELVRSRLRELEGVVDRGLEELSGRLADLGRHPPSIGRNEAVVGRNCWERLARLQDGYRDVIRRLKRLAVRWEEEHPEDAALAAAVRDGALRSRSVVGDLLARSDPHALD